jgi:GNAT superfamily N-acetyltransferase
VGDATNLWDGSIAHPASATDTPTVANVLARAFAADPVLTSLLGHSRDIVARLTRYFETEASLALTGRGEVWLDSDGLGAAIWRQPGGWPDSARAQIRSLPVYLGVFSRRILVATRVVNELARSHPRDPHWYLPFIGVVPDAVGSGRGTALLAPVLRRCDKDRVGAYLEATSANSARLFARLGFVPRGDITLASGVNVQPMWREPNLGSTDDGTER